MHIAADGVRVRSLRHCKRASLISVQGLCKQFGGFTALDRISFDVKKGSITGIIGPNGAGKTTLFDVITGNTTPTAGTVSLEGQAITGLAPHELFSLGILRTFQIPQEFPTLSVRDNLMMVPANQLGETLWNCWFQRKKIALQESEIAAKAQEVMEFLTVAHLADEPAANLSGGQKKLLELGRTMMVNPSLVFVDEVGAGVNRTLLKTIGDAILRFNRERSCTFCVIEHDFAFVSRICDSVKVLAEGRLLAEGTVEDIRRDDRVIEAYLGRSAARDKSDIRPSN